MIVDTKKELALFAVEKVLEFRDRLRSIAEFEGVAMALRPPFARRDQLEIGNMHGQLSAYMDMACRLANVPIDDGVGRAMSNIADLYARILGMVD